MRLSNAVVDEFYDQVVEDPRLSRFFEGADMNSLRKHQFSFMRYSFSEGRAGTYTGRQLSDAHSRLIRDMGLNENHFDYVVEDLVNVLEKFQVPENLIQQVVKTVSPLREHFVVA